MLTILNVVDFVGLKKNIIYLHNEQLQICENVPDTKAGIIKSLRRLEEKSVVCSKSNST